MCESVTTPAAPAAPTVAATLTLTDTLIQIGYGVTLVVLLGLVAAVVLAAIWHGIAGAVALGRELARDERDWLRLRSDPDAWADYCDTVAELALKAEGKLPAHYRLGDWRPGGRWARLEAKDAAAP